MQSLPILRDVAGMLTALLATTAVLAAANTQGTDPPPCNTDPATLAGEMSCQPWSGAGCEDDPCGRSQPSTQAPPPQVQPQATPKPDLRRTSKQNVRRAEQLKARPAKEADNSGNRKK